MSKCVKKIKAGKIIFAIFAAIGMYVVASLISQVIIGRSMSEHECWIHASSSYPSPLGEYVAELVYESCGNTNAVSEVSLRRTSNKSEATILLSVKRNIQERGGVPYPPAVTIRWESAGKLVITAPREDLPDYKSEKTYGVAVSYAPAS